MTRRSVHLVVKGLVQGVCYRATAQDEARGLGLAGWVRNLPNGDVEARAQGDAAKVDAFVAWCRRGPEEARVESVSVDDVPAEEGLSDFRVVR
ncbi:MAG: acylphosphatase [Myxococcota bacterium]